MITRRTFLLLVLLLLGLDFGIGHFLGRAEPPGWTTQRWEAGFGSWASGGYGVAYNISMPKDYDFQQKCGKAWISSPDVAGDFTIQLSFLPSAKFEDTDFNEYMKSDAPHAASSFGKSPNDIEIGKPADFDVAALHFSRIDLTIKNARLDDDAENSSKIMTARAFRLKGSRLDIIADFSGPDLFAVNERIVQSIRPARGFGLVELMLGAIPNLLGC